jgi:hypothetical protein
MTERRRKTLVFGTLAVAIVWGIWNNPFSAAKIQHADVAEPMPSDTLLQQQANTESVTADGQFAEDIWRGNPFARRGVACTSTSVPLLESRPSFALSAVSESGGSRMAVINGRVVAPGDKIDGWMVSKIADGTVTLADGEKVITLSMADR